MGRPPGNGGPTFRFNPVEVGEMEAILQAHNYAVPAREILEALAQRFSSSAERAGQVEVSGKQVWNWFQNRRYALRAKAARPSVPGQVIAPPVPKGDEATVKTVPLVPHPQAPQPQPAPSVRSMPQLPHPLPAPSAAQSADRNALENFQMEFEAKSARDGAWYDVASFLSHRSLETGDPEALVRFSGFGPEEDEWVNIRKHVRQRSLPCESSECVAILPGDLILCFQEGKEQALYFDAHVLDAQRRRHDVRGCRCRILVRYDHDQSEEIVPLRKICRRPETDYRMQQLHAEFVNMNPQKTDIDSQVGNASKVVAAGGTTQMQTNTTMPTNFSVAGESTLQPSNLKVDAASGTTQMQMTNATTPTNVSVAGESKLQPFNLKIDVVGGPTQMQMITSTMPTNVSVAGESKLQPCNLKVGAAGGTPQMQMTTATMPTNVFVAGESKLQPSNLKVDAAGGTTQMQMTTVTTPTNVSVAGESKFQPSNLKVDAAGQMQVDIANTLANVSVAGESKLQQSNLKVDASEGTPHMQMTTATTPANVSVAIESKLQPSNLKVDASGGTTQMQMTTATTPANISLTGESELQPSNMKVDASGETTQMQMTNATTPTNISVASESVKMFDAGNSTAVGDTNFSRTAVVNTTTADGPNPSMQQGEIEVKNSYSDNFV